MVKEIEALGQKAIYIKVDIADEKAVHAVVAQTVDTFGRLDILVCCAGILGKEKPFLEQTAAEFQRVLQINVVGVYYSHQAAIPHMLERGEGHVINMASVAGLIAAPTITSYAAGKYGVRAFTDSLRREVSHLGIKVSGIYPGPAVTEFGEKLERTKSRETIKRIKYPHMSSEYVAQRVVAVAKRPRRTLVIPWWFRIITTFDTLFPVAVDWITYIFSKKNHNLD